MSKDILEKKLDLLIYHIENLPRRMCDELFIRQKLKSIEEKEKKLEEREALFNANIQLDNINE